MSNNVVLVTNDACSIEKMVCSVDSMESTQLFVANSFDDSIKLFTKYKCDTVIADVELYDNEASIKFLEQVRSLWGNVKRVLFVDDEFQLDFEEIINVAQINRVFYKSWDQVRIISAMEELISERTNTEGYDSGKLIIKQNKKLIFLNDMLEKQVLDRTEETLFANMKILSANVSAVKALIQAVEAKDVSTKGHSERVAHLCTSIGRELKLSDDEVYGLKMAALLHDIGKIGIREKVLLKPRELSNAEMKEIKEHPLIGYKIIKPINFSCDVAIAVLQHHEAHDGSGYPHGLTGGEICLGAKILHIADAYDAMTCDRPYRSALTEMYALEELSLCLGKQFDPEILKVFFSMLSAQKSKK